MRHCEFITFGETLIFRVVPLNKKIYILVKLLTIIADIYIVDIIRNEFSQIHLLKRCGGSAIMVALDSLPLVMWWGGRLLGPPVSSTVQKGLITL